MEKRGKLVVSGVTTSIKSVGDDVLDVPKKYPVKWMLI